MRKIVLLVAVLLLALSLPTVSMAGWRDRYFPRKVTFAGDIAVKEGYAVLDVYEHGKWALIEWEPVNLTFGYRAGDAVWNDFADLSLNWTEEYAEMPYDYFGRLHLRVHTKDEAAEIKYRFGRVTEGRHEGNFRYHLEGSGIWSDAGRTITCVEEPFTIYELEYQGKKKVSTFEPRWTGSLTFTIEIAEV